MLKSDQSHHCVGPGRAGVRCAVKVRPQSQTSRTDHGEKLERCAKLRKVSDLMHAEDGVGRDGAVTAFWSST